MTYPPESESIWNFDTISWLIIIIICFSTCSIVTYDEVKNGPARKAAEEQRKKDEVAQCEREGGSWTWGYFPLGVKGQTTKIWFCDK